MPAFTFEKISPPADRGPIPPVANKKQRGVIVQMLDRFAEARVKRALKEEKGVIARNPDTARRIEIFSSPCAATGCSSLRCAGAAPAPAHGRDRRR